MVRISPAGRFEGSPALPGDKSISHRYALLAALCPEETRIRNYSPSEDCRHTLLCLEALGAGTEIDNGHVRITGRPLGMLHAPSRPLDCGNSGTTIRLLSGILAGQSFRSVLTGDDSLQSRPMARVMTPQRKMGGVIQARAGDLAPLEIEGRPLHGVEYALPVASAQVKSCVLLAGLHASGRTEVVEPVPSRSHTERAFPLFSINVEIQNECISVRGRQQPRSPGDIEVPADPSAAAFFAVAACLLPGARVQLRNVNFNPARMELFRLLMQAGASVAVTEKTEHFGEPAATLEVRGDLDFLDRFPARLGGAMVPALIDEIPILAVLGTRLPGGLEIRDAAELRHKETDRIRTIASNLRALGATVREFEDGLKVEPCGQLRGGRVESHGDHRIAMAFAVAGLLASSEVEIHNPECAAVSYPSFFSNLEKLTGAAGPA